jgi:hypothetical protein
MYKENGDIMKKPTFPNPRPIREDFLPEPMKKYRIKKETYGDTTWYYPQVKILWWWHNLFAIPDFYDGGFFALEDAQKRLCAHIKGTMVEYIDFDCERDCK